MTRIAEDLVRMYCICPPYPSCSSCLVGKWTRIGEDLVRMYCICPPYPNSRFPIPDSLFPIPDSRFPIPDSLFPVPCSLSSAIVVNNCFFNGASK
ncbi:MAG: hypothetical protein F6K56_13915 [Moorea sp. SIO3G5]|nr:hypothetical protein [Moorena sp. SIO3G5]